MHIASIGIDLGKNTFHLVGLGERNQILLRKKLSRAQLLAYTANVPASLVGLESSSGSTGAGSHRPDQRDPWILAGTRHDLRGAPNSTAQEAAGGDRRCRTEPEFAFALAARALVAG